MLSKLLRSSTGALSLNSFTFTSTQLPKHCHMHVLQATKAHVPGIGHASHTWGSTIRGHRRALLMMRALSMLRLSFGSPSSIQPLMATGSPMTLASLKVALQGMPTALQPER